MNAGTGSESEIFGLGNHFGLSIRTPPSTYNRTEVASTRRRSVKLGRVRHDLSGLCSVLNSHGKSSTSWCHRATLTEVRQISSLMFFPDQTRYVASHQVLSTALSLHTQDSRYVSARACPLYAKHTIISLYARHGIRGTFESPTRLITEAFLQRCSPEHAVMSVKGLTRLRALHTGVSLAVIPPLRRLCRKTAIVDDSKSSLLPLIKLFYVCNIGRLTARADSRFFPSLQTAVRR